MLVGGQGASDLHRRQRERVQGADRDLPALEAPLGERAVDARHQIARSRARERVCGDVVWIDALLQQPADPLLDRRRLAGTGPSGDADVAGLVVSRGVLRSLRLLDLFRPGDPRPERSRGDLAIPAPTTTGGATCAIRTVPERARVSRHQHGRGGLPAGRATSAG